jgi:hypothetical protein
VRRNWSIGHSPPATAELRETAEALAEAVRRQVARQLGKTLRPTALNRGGTALSALPRYSGAVDRVPDSATLKRVAQSRRYPVWRVAHPFVDGTAMRLMRLIVWFPPKRPGEAVIVLFGADKAQMGDVFYNSVGPRADAAIESYLFRIQSEGATDE